MLDFLALLYLNFFPYLGVGFLGALAFVSWFVTRYFLQEGMTQRNWVLPAIWFCAFFIALIWSVFSRPPSPDTILGILLFFFLGLLFGFAFIYAIFSRFRDH